MAEPSGQVPKLNELTVEEKASLCIGTDFWHTGEVERVGIPSLRVSDGPHGLRRQPDEGSQVGIGGSLPATCFPTACALASSWDPELAWRVGSAMAEEAHDQGVHIVLGPGVNIKRSPRCGRNFEYFAEDPVLAGAMGTAMVKGLQETGVGASLKHFAANNQETDRMRVSAEVDERTLREIYLPAFEQVVTEAEPWTVMCAYNKLNGTYASEHHWLLTEVLREEWGYEGVVVSDWGAVHDRLAALLGGLDLEMPPHLGVSDVALVEAVKTGQLKESDLDVAVARLLALVDKAKRAERRGGRAFDQEAHHRLAREAAAECSVLLKNDGGLLPLSVSPGQLVAVIGEPAEHPRFQGGGSSKVNPTKVDIPWQELQAALPEGTQVAYAQGYHIGPHPEDGQLASEAVELAGRASLVVLLLGLAETEEGEGKDRAHIRLPEAQVSLLGQLAAVNPNIVVVLVNGSAVQVSEWQHHAPAILECWLSGQAFGSALADVLTGTANPSGRLAETVPLRLEDDPSYLNFPGEDGRVLYGEGIFVGYRGYDKLAREVSFPFGHGLSYTTFSYSSLGVSTSGSHDSGDLKISVSCRVANTGTRRGKEVVQLYVGDVHSSVARPVRELKAFTKVDLDVGQEKTVTFELVARDLSFWSSAFRNWLLEAGDFEVAVGSSSRELHLKTVIGIDAPSPKRPLDHMSTLQEWLSDPEGAAALRAAADKDPSGQMKELVGNAELVTVIGMFPISTVAAFAGIVIDSRTIDEVLPPERRRG